MKLTKRVVLVLFIVWLLMMTLVAINPNGRNYASGAEDGYVRLHFFDKSYLDMKDPVPEEIEAGEEDEDEEETKSP
jgi:hypothetical protein